MLICLDWELYTKTVHIFLVLCTNLCTPSCVHGVQQAFNLISRTAVQNILNEQPRFERLQKNLPSWRLFSIVQNPAVIYELNDLKYGQIFILPKNHSSQALTTWLDLSVCEVGYLVCQDLPLHSLIEFFKLLIIVWISFNCWRGFQKCVFVITDYQRFDVLNQFFVSNYFLIDHKRKPF